MCIYFIKTDIISFNNNLAARYFVTAAAAALMPIVMHAVTRSAVVRIPANKRN